MFNRKKNLEKEINKNLSGDIQKIALDWAAFLRAKDELSVEQLSCGGWNIYRKGINSAYMAFYRDRNAFDIVLHISSYDGENPVDDDLKEFAWSHVVHCPQGCGSSSFCEESRNRRTIFGKEYESLCQSPLHFSNPNVEELKKIQELLLLFY